MTYFNPNSRKPCVRCGITVTLGGRTGPVVVCTDCRDADTSYVTYLLEDA